MRLIRVGPFEFEGAEWPAGTRAARSVIPSFEREFGPHHRVVHEARQHMVEIGKKEEDEALENLREALARLER